MIVTPFKPADLEILEAGGVQESQRGKLSSSYIDLACMTSPGSVALTVRARPGDVIVCAGVVKMAPYMGKVWCVMASHAGAHMVVVHRIARRFLGSLNFVRLEAEADASFSAGCRWLELLGFEFEGAMRKYGPEGETYNRYARIRGG